MPPITAQTLQALQQQFMDHQGHLKEGELTQYLTDTYTHDPDKHQAETQIKTLAPIGYLVSKLFNSTQRAQITALEALVSYPHMDTLIQFAKKPNWTTRYSNSSAYTFQN